MPEIFPEITTLDLIRNARDQDIQVPEPNKGMYDWQILAEGDSWLSIGAFPSSNLLIELPLPKSSIIVNLAYPGDTIENMSSLSGNPDLKRMLFSERWGYKWDLILLSGGGNDVIGRAGEYIRPATSDVNKPESWIHQPTLKTMVEDVKKCYREIVVIRDEPGSINAGVPIVVHTYDYAMPRNAPAKFLIAGFLGPWLYRAMTRAGVPASLYLAIVRHAIDALAAGLSELEGPGGLSHFHVVNTCGVLTPAEPGSIGSSNDWLNEIHPNHHGYRKIARKLAPRIAQILS